MIDLDKTYESKRYGKFTIIKYHHAKKILVKFAATGYETYSTSSNINVKRVKDRLLPTVFGVGYIGGTEYKSSVDGKKTKEYIAWKGMIMRCYYYKYKELNPTYKGCYVCDEWHNFQNFAKWFHDNYISNCHLDKDIKIKGNKVYSPDTCLLVTQYENLSHASAIKRKFKNPEGNTVEAYSLRSLCLENNLNNNCMSRVYHGKQAVHRGWTKG